MCDNDNSYHLDYEAPEEHWEPTKKDWEEYWKMQDAENAAKEGTDIAADE